MGGGWRSVRDDVTGGRDKEMIKGVKGRNSAKCHNAPEGSEGEKEPSEATEKYKVCL